MDQRIGVAFSYPYGLRKRQGQYGLYPGNRAQYEGSRWIGADGKLVYAGLPLGGKGAAHLQPIFHYNAEDRFFAEMRFFDSATSWS